MLDKPYDDSDHKVAGEQHYNLATAVSDSSNWRSCSLSNRQDEIKTPKPAILTPVSWLQLTLLTFLDKKHTLAVEPSRFLVKR